MTLHFSPEGVIRGFVLSNEIVFLRFLILVINDKPAPLYLVTYTYIFVTRYYGRLPLWR